MGMICHYTMYILQCRHLISALNALAARANHTTAHPIAIQFPGHRCMEDITNTPSFDSQATLVMDVPGYHFICYTWMFVLVGTARRPVEWCRNLISEL